MVAAGGKPNGLTGVSVWSATVGNGLGVGVADAVAVAVTVGVWVRVGVAVRVLVALGVSVKVGETVAVAVYTGASCSKLGRVICRVVTGGVAWHALKLTSTQAPHKIERITVIGFIQCALTTINGKIYLRLMLGCYYCEGEHKENP